MKIPLINLDGKIISKIKSFVLECFSCWYISRKGDLQFCPKCGKNTMLKVTCEFKNNGQLILYRKKDKRIRVRGSRYPIPNPVGGRRVHDLILNEDELNKPKVQSYIKKMKNLEKKKQKKMALDFDMARDFTEVRKDNKMVRELKIGYGHKNPNVNSFWKGKKKRN